jgi:TonB family protein
MRKKSNIFKDTGCLSRIGAEKVISGTLTEQEKQLVEKHVKVCDLCREATEGLPVFDSTDQYIAGLKELEMKWKAISVSRRNARYWPYAITAVAAGALVLISISYMLNNGIPELQPEIADLADKGESLDNLIRREGIFIRPVMENEVYTKTDPEDMLRSAFDPGVGTDETRTPVAQLSDTRIFSVESNVPAHYKLEVSTVQSVRAESSRLRYPYKVMNHPPANLRSDMAEEESADDEEFFLVEDMPKFNQGDYSGFLNYIKSRLVYPEKAIQQKISGTVYVQFTVDKQGRIADIKVLRGAHKLLDDEVIRIVSGSPEWEPGRQRGRAVNVALVVPVDFVLVE